MNSNYFFRNMKKGFIIFLVTMVAGIFFSSTPASAANDKKVCEGINNPDVWMVVDSSHVCHDYFFSFDDLDIGDSDIKFVPYPGFEEQDIDFFYTSTTCENAGKKIYEKSYDICGDVLAAEGDCVYGPSPSGSFEGKYKVKDECLNLYKTVDYGKKYLKHCLAATCTYGIVNQQIELKGVDHGFSGGTNFGIIDLTYSVTLTYSAGNIDAQLRSDSLDFGDYGWYWYDGIGSVEDGTIFPDFRIVKRSDCESTTTEFDSLVNEHVKLSNLKSSGEEVLYGSTGCWVRGFVQNGETCNTKTFGEDPLPGYYKECARQR